MLVALAATIAGAQGTAAAIRGTVTDSVHGGPLAGARVVASRAVERDSIGTPSDYAATTDARGHFEISPLRAAVYLVTVQHPWLDSTGFEVAARTVDLRDGSSATLTLAVPSGSTIKSAFCPTIGRDSTVGFVEGFVRDAQSDLAVAGVRVVFAWTDFTVDTRTARARPHHHTVAANTARDGSYLVCGLPLAQSFLMQAQIGERAATGAVEAQIPPGGVLVETLRIAVNTAETATVSGEIHREGSMIRIAGAHVHVFGIDDEAITASDGSFHLGGVPIGTQSIEVTALGLRPLRYPVDVKATEPNRVDIGMSTTAQQLDTVRSFARRSGAPALRDEFDQRAFRGTGQYITEDMIARSHPWQTTDLVRHMRGFEFRGDTVFSTRGEYAVGATSDCKPLLLIDGSPADSMNEVLPVAIHGIEVYAGDINVPLRYASSTITTGCGAIFIWTK